MIATYSGFVAGLWREAMAISAFRSLVLGLPYPHSKQILSLIATMLQKELCLPLN
jgi:hypothetical protein